MRRVIRQFVPLIVVAVAAILVYRWWIGRSQTLPGTLRGSGTIEVTEITVAAESAGRVKKVFPAEGERVQAGQTIVQLDDAILRAQLRQAEATLEAARGTQAASEAAHLASEAQLDQLRAGARPQEIAAERQAVAAAQGRVTTAEGQLAQTRGALQSASAQRDQAVARFAQVKQGARPEAIDTAAVMYQQAEAAVRKAQADYDKVAGRPDASASPQALALQQATLAMEAAKSNYQGLLSGATTPELDQSRAGVQQAVAGIIQASAAVSQTEAALLTSQAGLAGEQARLDLLQAGTRPEQVRAAEAQVAAAKAQAKATASQVAAAQAAVSLIQEQIGRQAIKAPADGYVLTRAIEPGEVALPGGALLVIGDLLKPTVTVYLPEDQYGAVRVGDSANLAVDSFPGLIFKGTVQRVADKAEFTPRNVQTPAGRRTTVFAVKVALDNPEGMLKPGMPADVSFGP